MMASTDDSLNKRVGLFFVVNGEMLLHTCSIVKGEKSGVFVNYPESHYDVWEREYSRKYGGIDFDYFPRGRIVFNRKTGEYLLYHDSCIAAEAESLRGRYPERTCTLTLDEHYQCHRCNRNYVM